MHTEDTITAVERSIKKDPSSLARFRAVMLELKPNDHQASALGKQKKNYVQSIFVGIGTSYFDNPEAIAETPLHYISKTLVFSVLYGQRESIFLQTVAGHNVTVNKEGPRHL